MGDPTSTRVTLRNKFELEKRHRSYADFRAKSIKPLPNMKPSPSNDQKAMKIEEIVKHMKHLPTYLERGTPIHDRALNFGVMEWGRLEKWQYGHHKPGPVRSNKCSPASTISSSLFSTDGSSPLSSSIPSCSPARQKVNRVTLQSHFKSSPNGLSEIKPESKSSLDTGKLPASSSFSKMKVIQNEPVNQPRNVQNHVGKHKTIVFSPRNGPGSYQLNGTSSENPRTELDSARNQSNPLRNETPERSAGSSKNSDLKSGNIRSKSPLRRFSFSFSKKPDSFPVSQKDNNTRAHSSPLRRLLDPIFLSKTRQFTETPHQDSKTKAKSKLDFTRVELSSRKQALFQTAVKNGRLLFTFAVENDILAATVTGLSSSGKDDSNNWLYTFFIVQEVKKKGGSWLSHGGKTKDSGYIPNVRAQMKVSNPSSFHRDTWEFVLFSVDSNVQPLDEVEAIVVKFSRKADEVVQPGSFSTTVVLPGGNHGVPSKGGPSPLTDRWRSGGVCDCGGWDIGCRLRILANDLRSSGSKSGKFELFFQGEVTNKRPFFSLSPLKEGIFSVDYNSSLSLLQAFSICISVVECRKITYM